MYMRHDASTLQALASEVFNRSWQFIERDPVLFGEDRDGLQERLAELILLLMSDGERNVIVVANKAIGLLRQEFAREREEAA
jgi:hypothetical protein